MGATNLAPLPLGPSQAFSQDTIYTLSALFSLLHLLSLPQSSPTSDVFVPLPLPCPCRTIRGLPVGKDRLTAPFGAGASRRCRPTPLWPASSSRPRSSTARRSWPPSACSRSLCSSWPAPPSALSAAAPLRRRRGGAPTARAHHRLARNCPWLRRFRFACSSRARRRSFSPPWQSPPPPCPLSCFSSPRPLSGRCGGPASMTRPSAPRSRNVEAGAPPRDTPPTGVCVGETWGIVMSSGSGQKMGRVRGGADREFFAMRRGGRAMTGSA